MSLLTTLSLVFSLTLGMLCGDITTVSAAKKDDGVSTSGPSGKISPSLSNSGSGSANSGKGRKGDAASQSDRIKVILQLQGKASKGLDDLLKSVGVRVHKVFKNLDTQVVELPSATVSQLAAFDEVKYISADAQVETLGGHVSTTTGTDDIRVHTNVLGQSIKLDGKGIGIAVLDSGIDANHIAFLGAAGSTRIVYSKDFTGEGRTDDPYGHGTHVASIG
ncbi:MAG TPA: S8 family serine peptidase, partial [Pyrinomonadaceae bacterium]